MTRKLVAEFKNLVRCDVILLALQYSILLSDMPVGFSKIRVGTRLIQSPTMLLYMGNIDTPRSN